MRILRWLAGMLAVSAAVGYALGLLGAPVALVYGAAIVIAAVTIAAYRLTRAARLGRGNGDRQVGGGR